MTELLSTLSDVFFERFAVQAARRYAPLLGIPVHFVEMLFLIEDKRFPLHFGLDPIAITRAAVFNLRGCALQGGSTITQQLCSNRQQQRHARGWKRIRGKVFQCLSSIVCSATTPKSKILGDYLEIAYWGKSYYGIDRAAAGYFGKTRDSLSVAQSFFLAERIAAPNRMCIARISNLFQRGSIANSFRRHGTTPAEIAAVYERRFKSGSDVAHLFTK